MVVLFKVFSKEVSVASLEIGMESLLEFFQGNVFF